MPKYIIKPTRVMGYEMAGPLTVERARDEPRFHISTSGGSLRYYLSCSERLVAWGKNTADAERNLLRYLVATYEYLKDREPSKLTDTDKRALENLGKTFVPAMP